MSFVRQPGDPTLIRTRVVISHTASDGYRAEFVTNSKAENSTPQKALLGAIDELSRLCELYGFGDEAQAAFEAARNRFHTPVRPGPGVDLSAGAG